MKNFDTFIQEKLRLSKSKLPSTDFLKDLGDGDYENFDLSNLENNSGRPFDFIEAIEMKIYRSIPQGSEVYRISDDNANFKKIKTIIRGNTPALYGNTKNQILIYKIFDSNIIILVNLYDLPKLNKVNLNDIYIYEAD